MFKLYLDDDSEAEALVLGLRSRGIDVVTATTAGMRGARDVDHSRFATLSGRVLYTGNRGDFASLHAAVLLGGDHHGGIIIRSSRSAIGTQIRAASVERAGAGPAEEF